MLAMSTVLAVDAETLTETSIDPWMAALALVVMLLAWILSRAARKAMARVMTRLEGITPELRDLIARTVGYLVIFIGVGVALSLLGVPIQPLLAAVIVIGIVLALALRGIAENFAAGIVLQTRRPIHLGDEVQSLGYVGNVVEMNSRVVVVETFDGRLAHLPNSEVLREPLLNHSEHGSRRSDVEVRVRSRDFEEVRSWLSEAVGAAPGVMADPAPVVYLTGVDPVRVTALVHFWHDPDDGLTVRTSVIHALAGAGVGRTEMAAIVTPQPPPPLTPSAWL